MTAFIDVTCLKCHRRHGWCGELSDPAPPCPNCGHDGSEGLEKDIVKAREVLEPQPRTPEGYFKARYHAGLSIGQAAKLLKTTATHLVDVEDGAEPPGADLVASMKEVYEVDFERRDGR